MTDIRTMRTVADTMMANEGQNNAGGQRRLYPGSQNAYYDSAPLTEYPKMLYRKTDVEQIQESADAIGGLKDAPMVINRYDGLLCETTIALSADEAEALATGGWDISPKAAYGIEDGLIRETSAKDEEIAELRRMLAERDAPRRGRPPRVDNGDADI